MRACLLVLILLFAQSSHAQPANRGEFALAFNTSLDKSRAFRETVASAEKALQIASTLKQDSLVQQAETQLGILYWNDGQLNDAARVLKDAARIAGERHDAFGVARCTHYAALVQYYLCRFDSALSLYSVAEQGYTVLHIDSAVAKIKSHQALIFSLRGEYDQAIQALIASHRIQESMPGYRDLSIPIQFPSDAARRMYFRDKLKRDLESLAFLERGNDRSKLGITWFNVGKDYQYLGEYSKAIHYLKKSITGFTDAGEVPYYSDVGQVYTESGRHDSAHFYFRTALANELERGTRIHLTNIYGAMAILHEKEKNYAEALRCWNLTQELNKEIGLRRSEAQAGHRIADLLIRLGRLDDALKEINASLAIANELVIPADKQGFLKAKATILSALGRYKDAVDAMAQREVIAERVINGEMNLQIAQQEISYETERKNRELEQLQAQNRLKQVEIEKRNLYLLIGVILVVMTTTVIFLVYRRYRNKAKTSQLLEKQNKQIQSQNEALTIKSREEEALMREIHHRVKNNLQVISSLINLKLGQSSDETAEALHQLNGRIFSMGLIHEKLYQKENIHTIKLDEYLADLAHYLMGTLSRDELAVRLQFDCDPVDLDAERVVACGLISNELITNAMKHAYHGVAQPVLRIVLKASGGFIHFEIADNGTGAPKLEAGNSFGLRFVEQLVISKLHGTMQVETIHGFRTMITLPAIDQPSKITFGAESVSQTSR